MPRRRCCGIVEEIPCCQRFVPEGGTDTGVYEISLEELEAVRLKDVEGMDQTACAIRMRVSRPTFQRILQRARNKIALALVKGQTIIIQGGHYMLKNRVFECADCGHTWEVEPCSEGGKHGYEIACPKCGSMKKFKLSDEGEKHACGGGHHHGGCCGGHNHE